MPGNIRNLVERQVVKWTKVREAHARAEQPEPTLRPRPVISLSREAGSLGAEVGATVAKRLELDLFDREIVERIAENAEVRAALVDSVDDKVADAIENWLGQHLGKTQLAHSDYLRHLSQVLLTLSRHGRAVVIGRGAQFILDPEWTLRVRLSAPQELRIGRVAARDRIEVGTARQLVQRIDADRRAFARRHFGVEISDPGHYDLVINTQFFGVDDAAELVARAFRARFG